MTSLDVQRELARLAAVKKLHRMETVRLRSQQCWDGDCDHDDEPDCEAAAGLYDVCRHCYGNALEIDDETSRWIEVALWPCATAIALGYPLKETS